MPDVTPEDVRALIAKTRENVANQHFLFSREFVTSLADALETVSETVSARERDERAGYDREARAQAFTDQEDADLDAAWEECRTRRGTFSGDEKIARAYFEEGRASALASRTVETAEEWEYLRVSPGRVEQRVDRADAATHRRTPGIDPSPWEPVPPTPEEGKNA